MRSLPLTWLSRFAPAVLIACAPDATTDGSDDAPLALTTCDASAEHIGVVTEITFVRGEDGVSDGFDLDGEVSSPGGASGCGVGDDTAPDGTPGIDNAFARLLPALELTEAQAVEEIIQAAINNGELLLMIRMTGVDDLVDDDCVTVEILKGQGTPAVGAPGWINPGQTFDRDPDLVPTTVEDVELVDGELVATPFDVTLPISILNADFDIDVLDAAVRLELGADGSVGGVLAGGVDVASLLETVTMQGVNNDVLAVVAPIIDAVTDLAPDDEGQCTRMSVTLRVQAVPAFLFDTP